MSFPWTSDPNDIRQHRQEREKVPAKKIKAIKKTVGGSNSQIPLQDKRIHTTLSYLLSFSSVLDVF